MRAGKLRHLVQIERATETRDAVGGVTQSWAKLDKRWADVKPLAGREFFEAAAINSGLTHQVRIRFFAGITNKDRIAIENPAGTTRYLNIGSVINADERNREQILMCKEDTT